MKHKILGKGVHIQGFHNTLLLLRVVAGALMLHHGWHKLMDFDMYLSNFSTTFGQFASLCLAVVTFLEVAGSCIFILGMFVRVTSILLACTMLVASIVDYLGHVDGFDAAELPVLFLSIFIITSFYGAGKYSLDKLFFNIQ